MKMRLLASALFFSSIYGSTSIAEFTIIKAQGDGSLTRIVSKEYTKNENVIVKGAMEARRWVDLFTGGNVSVNSGGFWTKMRVDASE